MKQRLFPKNLIKRIAFVALVLFLLQPCAFSTSYGTLDGKSERETDSSKILKEIYREVKELGSYPNEDFIKREFHMDLDGNDTNSEEHVVVLIYESLDGERMVLQVTYFEPEKNNRIIKNAKNIRVISSFIKGDNLEIYKNEYSEKETRPLLADILKGIRSKKELLKQIDRKN